MGCTMILIFLFPIAGSGLSNRKFYNRAVCFRLGISGCVGGLMLVAMGLLYLVRRYFPPNSSFVFRHALSNLFRPNNQTQVLLVTIGLGAFIIATLKYHSK
jgi:putative ABC transport system permease protein